MADAEEKLELTTTQQAEKEFVLAIKRAKRDGVDVSSIFLEVREQVMLAWVRMFGLMLGIIFIFICPLLIPLYKVFCFHIGMAYDLSEWFYYWPCIVGIVSIIAFGFDLVDPRNLKRIVTRKDDAPDAPGRISRSGRYLVNPKELEDFGANGDV
jgi:hypothetical protein